MSDLRPGPLTPLHVAQQWLRERVDEGEKCPCCTQFAKVYKRKIHAGMAAMLISMYRKGGLDWVYLPDVPQKSRDGTGLQWWGLIEEERHVMRPDGGRAGYWRVTGQGEQFINRMLRVPTYARIYDGRFLGHTGERVGILDCLGEKFDYTELMTS